MILSCRPFYMDGTQPKSIRQLCISCVPQLLLRHDHLFSGQMLKGLLIPFECLV